MKNLKNYAMALVALFIAATSLTLMSFVNKQKQTELEWFSVDPSGSISNTPMSGPPSGDCSIEVQENFCAVELPEDHSYTNISVVPNSYQKAGRVE
ncbi:hypothetical protein [Sphingobacterium cavernae]|uniref:hypothetical protein n=1 Tax=Sphingobacterium cavernae TaxID=2592657 RepID=UPI001230231C|nr:hypothetical protein [Sphingobacterium cavernae]